jgi:hypothetical protein
MTPRPPIWACDPNFVTCQRGHLKRRVDDGASVDMSRVTGYCWFRCNDCACYWLGIIGRVGETTYVQCYAVSQAQWHDRGTLCADDVEPPELLRLLGYNDQYRRAA